MATPQQRLPSRKERFAEDALDRLTPVMSVLGFLFLLVVLGERLAVPGGALSLALTVVSWTLWLVFLAEFVARAVAAPNTARFFRRHWWQVLFLLLPFLRFLRLVRAVHLLRAGRVASSALRSSRSAHSLMGSRVGWLAAVSAIVILSASQLLYEFGAYATYGDALHATALATIIGEPFGRPDGFSRLLEVLLGAFSVAIFATLAGTLGAYFLQSRPQPSPK